MIAIYLRFESEEQAEEILACVALLARDDIGPIVREIAPGVYGEDGSEITPPTTETVPGWHVNLIVEGEPAEALQPYLVTPATPVRRFAGF